MYLKASDLAQDDPTKEKRRKWVRYEGKHCLPAGHIDWHEWDGTRIRVCVILGDRLTNDPGRWAIDTINTKNRERWLIKW